MAALQAMHEHSTLTAVWSLLNSREFLRFMSRFHCERRFHLHFSWLLTFQFQIDIFNIEFSCGGYSNCYFFSRNSYCFIDRWLIPSGKISVSFSPSREEERAKSSATPMRWNIVHVSNELIRYCIPNHPEILLQQMISILLNPRGHSLNGEYALTRVHKACHATRISKMIPRVGCKVLDPRLWELFKESWRKSEFSGASSNKHNVKSMENPYEGEAFSFDEWFFSLRFSLAFYARILLLSDFFLKIPYFQASFDTFFVIEMIIRRTRDESNERSQPRDRGKNG